MSLAEKGLGLPPDGRDGGHGGGRVGVVGVSGGYFTRLESERDFSVCECEGATGAAAAHARTPRPPPRAATLATCKSAQTCFTLHYIYHATADHNLKFDLDFIPYLSHAPLISGLLNPPARILVSVSQRFVPSYILK